jgi:hypothetical protein
VRTKRALMNLKRKRRSGGRTRKRRRRAQRWRELLKMLVQSMEQKIGHLKVMMKTGRIMRALRVLKTLNSKRISNSSRCDCRLHSSRAAC